MWKRIALRPPESSVGQQLRINGRLGEEPLAPRQVWPARTGRFRVIALLGAVLVSGCANHPLDCATGLIAWADCKPGTFGHRQRQAQIERDLAACRRFGFAEGTDAFARCLLTLEQQYQHSQDAMLRAILTSGMLRPAPIPVPNSPASPPLTPSVSCISDQLGGTVYTNCR